TVGLGAHKRSTLTRIRHVLGISSSPGQSRWWLAGALTLVAVLTIGFGLSIFSHSAIAQGSKTEPKQEGYATTSPDTTSPPTISAWAAKATKLAPDDVKRANPDIKVTTTLVLDLADGSHILGEPGFTSISLRTPFDKIEIPLKHLQLVRPHEDNKTAFVHLRNGNRLTGALDIENPLKLKTLMGRVSEDLQHIRSAGVLQRITLSEKLKEALVLYYPFDEPAQKVSKTTAPITKPPDPRPRFFVSWRFGQQRKVRKLEGMVKDQSGKGNHGGNYGAKYTP
ncbi:unnamed protein product, partial [marine sediment metagenome]